MATPHTYTVLNSTLYTVYCTVNCRLFFSIYQTYLLCPRKPQNKLSVHRYLSISCVFIQFWPSRYRFNSNFQSWFVCHLCRSSQRDTRFYSLFVQGSFFGNAKPTNAVFLSNIQCFAVGYHKAQLYLVWLHKCW